MQNEILSRRQWWILYCLYSGELSGKDLRERFKKKSGLSVSGPSFYASMARLQEGGFVNRREETGITYGQVIKTYHFSLTNDGMIAVVQTPPPGPSWWQRLVHLICWKPYPKPEPVGATGWFQKGLTAESGKSVWQANQINWERTDFPYNANFPWRIAYKDLPVGTEFYDHNDDTDYVKLTETRAQHTSMGDLLAIDPDHHWMVRIDEKTYAELPEKVKHLAHRKTHLITKETPE